MSVMRLVTHAWMRVAVLLTFMAAIACAANASGIAFENESFPPKKPVVDFSMPVDWTGSWRTQWRGGGATMVLEQFGTNVRGTYSIYDGTIEAVVEGRRLVGTWTDRGGSGGFEFAMSEDERSFAGRFASGEWWNGERLQRGETRPFLEPDLSSPRSAMRSFLIAGNAMQGGAADYLTSMLQSIDFGPDRGSGSLNDQQAIATKLFAVLDQLTVHVWRVPGSSETDTAEAVLEQSGTTEDVRFEFRRDRYGDWRIVPPDLDELDATILRLLDARNYERADRDNPADLRHPRATMRLFLESLHDWEHRSSEVIDTFDLRSFGGEIRAIEARLLADYLKQVIDRVGYVVWQELPNDPDSRTPFVYFQHPRGDIVIAPYRDADGDGYRWRFSDDTLRGVRGLYTAIEGMPVVEGTTLTGGNNSFFRLRELMREISPLLLQRHFLVETWQWLGLALLAAGGLLCAWLVTALVSLGASWWFRADAIHRRRNRIRFFLPLRGLIAAAFWEIFFPILGLPESFARTAHVVGVSVALISGVWLFLNMIDVVGGHLSKRAQQSESAFDDILISLASGVAKVVAILVAIVVFAEALSIPYRSLLAGLGIGGLAFAIAARDTIANFFGSAVLLADRPFRQGDLVKVDDNLGFIERVGIRSTSIRTYDDSLVVMPNNVLATTTIENLGRRRMRRVRTVVAVTYDTPPALIAAFSDALRELILRTPECVNDDIHVYVREFAASSIDVGLIFYVRAATLGDEYRQRHHIMVEIVRIAGEMGVEFAFPTRTLHVAQEDAAGRTEEERRIDEDAFAAAIAVNRGAPETR